MELKILNENKKDPGKKPFDPSKIEFQNGLNIAYDKEELKKYYPHLISEISNNEKIMKIDSVSTKIEKNAKKTPKKYQDCIPKELINPGAIEFIRRCIKIEEAFKILNYLLDRNEINLDEYNTFKNQLKNENDLKEFINKHGGFKNPGYYERKYYKKKVKSHELSKNED